MAARLDFEIDSELETGLITGHAGVVGLIEAFRQTGTAAVIDRVIQVKSRKRGLTSRRWWRACWRCGRPVVSGRGPRPSPPGRGAGRAARLRVCRRRRPRATFSAFHGDDLPLLHEGKSTVPSESRAAPGSGHGQSRAGPRSAMPRPVSSATLDIDATVIASTSERPSRRTTANVATSRCWPVGRAGRHRRRRVPRRQRAGRLAATARMIEKAVAALPGTFDKIYLRGDSALYEHEAMPLIDERPSPTRSAPT